jgi:hypothetical protein
MLITSAYNGRGSSASSLGKPALDNLLWPVTSSPTFGMKNDRVTSIPARLRK